MNGDTGSATSSNFSLSDAMDLQNTSPTGYEVEVIDYNERAREILETGKPIDFILEEFHQIHIGDQILAKFLLACIGCQLCNNTEGLQPGLTGESGKGKSYACKAMLHLVPEDYKKMGSFSDKAYFHIDLTPGTIIFLDDIEHISEELERLIKVSSSQFQSPYTHCYTDMQKRGDSKGSIVTIPPRISWWITSKDADFDIQVLNRVLTLAVDETVNQDMAVAKMQMGRARTGITGFELSPEVHICRGMFETLHRKGVIKVVIPYANLIEWKNIENRRNFPMFLDTIKSSAALNQFQRTKNNNRSVIANLDDFDYAKDIWNYVGKDQVSKLKTKELMALKVIRDSKDIVITFTDLQIKTQFPKSTLYNLLNGKRQNDGTHDGGLLNKVKGLIEEKIMEEDMITKKKTVTRYSFKGDIPLWDSFENIVSLTDREAAQKEIDNASTN